MEENLQLTSSFLFSLSTSGWLREYSGSLSTQECRTNFSLVSTCKIILYKLAQNHLANVFLSMFATKEFLILTEPKSFSFSQIFTKARPINQNQWKGSSTLGQRIVETNNLANIYFLNFLVFMLVICVLYSSCSLITRGASKRRRSG